MQKEVKVLKDVLNPYMESVDIAIMGGISESCETQQQKSHQVSSDPLFDDKVHSFL